MISAGLKSLGKSHLWLELCVFGSSSHSTQNISQHSNPTPQHKRVVSLIPIWHKLTSLSIKSLQDVLCHKHLQNVICNRRYIFPWWYDCNTALQVPWLRARFMWRLSEVESGTLKPSGEKLTSVRHWWASAPCCLLRYTQKGWRLAPYSCRFCDDQLCAW